MPLLPALLILAQGLPSTPPPQGDLAPCRAGQLRLLPEDRDGDVNGMSHSGTGFALANRGAACRLPALPQVVLRDARGRALPVARRAPVGMHPGPVMVPLRLEKGARAQGTLRWVSGPVYDGSRKLVAARLSVQIGKQWVSMPLKAVLYAPADQGASLDQPPLQLAGRR
ncbi:DUF4232 domain-containing protein [Novosphingobium rosa]|uniref:DUF4232 domain-containing protein n=1 Tax=Novosphingobium rosa TaxID=76978 RepID=UPI00082DDE17|nr:DUF4232 domain-containing protein [Novosphingobium rosa]